MQFAMLVGGRGSRLGALAADTPKPLLPVAGRPFLDLLIERAVGAGFGPILLLAGHLGGRVAERWRGREVAGVPVEVVVEPAPQGTGGALAAAAGHLEPVFALANGDSLFGFDLARLAAFEPAGPWLGKLALRRLEDSGRSGVVDLDGDRVTAFRERGEAGRPGVVNGGVYILRREILGAMGPPPCSLEADIFPALAGRGLLAGRIFDGFFIDIGVPDDYARAQTLVPAFLRD